VKHQENILVVPEEHFTPNQLSTYSDIGYSALSTLLEHSELHKRADMEKDPSYKQIIPYVIVENERGEILTYKRSNKSGENRLHDMYSIGVGGHLDEITSEPATKSLDLYFKGMVREIKEEIDYNAPISDFEINATIYDNSNDVGKVHLGVVSTLKVSSRYFDSHQGETDVLVDREWLSKEELIKRVDSLENWSKIIVENNYQNHL